MIVLPPHGYLKLITHYGSDEQIVAAARMSTDKGFLGWGPNHSVGCIFHTPMATASPKANPVLDCCPGAPGDEKLLRYLMHHEHMTPFEMAGAIVEIQAPIFVFREWHRHRTQCLGADTLVHFDLPKSTSNRHSVYKLRIEDIWRKWQPTIRTTRPERQVNALWPRTRVSGMQLRCLNEADNEISHTTILDVIRGEPKPMVRITTASGRQLTATREHRVHTPGGWMSLGEAITLGMPLTLEGTTRGKTMRWDIPDVDPTTECWRRIPGWDQYEVSDTGRVRRNGCTPKRATVGANGYDVVSLSRDGRTSVYCVHTLVLATFVGAAPSGNEARHLNSNRADNRLTNLAWGSAEDNAADRITADRQQRLVPTSEELVDVINVGEQPTYDLSVAGPWHNFVADGFIVHNSYNELSARYVQMPNLHYLPDDSRVRKQAVTNKQSTSDEPIDGHILREWKRRVLEEQALVYENYQWAIDNGISRELARLDTPVARFSRMRASANLRNWLGFLTLRNDPTAQWEIRQYAAALEDVLADLFPRTIEIYQAKRAKWQAAR